MTHPEVIAQLTASRQAFLAAIQGLSEETLTRVPVEGTWTIKDLIGHLTAWELALLTPLKASSRSLDPDNIRDDKITDVDIEDVLIADHDAWNAAQAQKRARWSLARVLDEYHAVRQELLQTLQDLEQTQWEINRTAPWGEQAPLENLLSGLVWHESDEHLKSINFWKQTGKPR
jgi:uncharacterized damage-inducible protein DinB